MTSDERFQSRLQRLQRWVDRAANAWQKALSETEGQFVRLLQEMEEKKLHVERELGSEEELLKIRLEQAGQEYVQAKYRFEKDSTETKAEAERLVREIESTKQRLVSDLNRLNQEKLNNQISFERQKNALQDLYQEKKRHLLVTREKLVRELAQSQNTHRQYKEKHEKETDRIQREFKGRIEILKDQLHSKQQGWEAGKEAMKKDLLVLEKQKSTVEKELATLQSNNQNEIGNLHLQIEVTKEQLELDKVTLIEKAEEDQRTCEKDVRDLEDQINKQEQELQSLILQKETEKKNAEDAFLHEEVMLKDTLKNEAEKRDYEQKLYAQEKTSKDIELNRKKEEYERKKNQWDNQIKTLLMQKSLQEAGQNADRMRTEREARVIVRSLEAKRDEMRRRLADIKSRYEAVQSNADKELDLLKQRWQWRKERLWQMWEARLATLKKERQVLAGQLSNLEENFRSQSQGVSEDTLRQDTQAQDLQQSILHSQTQWAGERRQREIQLELEKTRVIAQIKECETLVTEWMDKQKMTHDEVSRRKGAFVDDIDFLDRYYRSQQDETEVFLSVFQRALSVLTDELERFGLKQDAA